MKKINFFFLIVSMVVFYSCGNNAEDKTTSAAPEGMHLLDVTRYGKPFSIYVPDTNKAKLQIVEQSSGELHIKAGNQFAVSITNGSSDLELKKNDIRSDEVNKLKAIEVDEPGGVIWQSEITTPEFHFIRNSKAGSEEFSFEDIRREDGNNFGKETIQQMYNSCKNIVSASPGEASR